jgi:hypothetical protein
MVEEFLFSFRTPPILIIPKKQKLNTLFLNQMRLIKKTAALHLN